MRDREWWSTAKRAAGEARNSETPVLTDASGATHTSNREKAETFGQHFSSKCSLGDQDFLNLSVLRSQATHGSAYPYCPL